MAAVCRPKMRLVPEQVDVKFHPLERAAASLNERDSAIDSFCCGDLKSYPDRPSVLSNSLREVSRAAA